jgi:lipopolysaccharide biosynthesis glycosyltransferase
MQFINMQNKFNDVWPDNPKKTFGYTKEVIYKIVASSLFPSLDRIVMTDVDVIYLGDFSASYFADLDQYYFAGIRPCGRIINYYNEYKKRFSSDEISKMQSIGGGFLVANLKYIRETGFEKVLVEYLFQNVNRLVQLEQDVINACSFRKVKYLPLKYMVCSYMYDLYKREESFKNDILYTEQELRAALANPIHLHYAGGNKPWKRACTKDQIWKEYEKEWKQKISQL